MEAQAFRVLTPAAMRFAGVPMGTWSSTLAQGLYPNAPPMRNKKEGRLFDVDDLISLRLYGELLAIGVEIAKAAPIASELRAVLYNDPNARKLYVSIINEPDGTTRAVVLQKPGRAQVMWTLDIASWRKAARETMQAETEAA